MSGFSAFVADFATHLSLETGWAWQVDGPALVLPIRGLALDLRPLWGLAQRGTPTAHLAQGVLMALREGSLADTPDRLRIHVASTPTAGQVALFLHPALWIHLVLDLPLRTQGLSWSDVPDPLALLPEALRLTMRAPDRLAPLYIGGPVAHYHGSTAFDAAIAYTLLADGALVAAVAPHETLVLQTAAWEAGVDPFRHMVSLGSDPGSNPPPPIWVFHHGALIARA